MVTSRTEGSEPLPLATSPADFDVDRPGAVTKSDQDSWIVGAQVTGSDANPPPDGRAISPLDPDDCPGSLQSTIIAEVQADPVPQAGLDGEPLEEGGALDIQSNLPGADETVDARRILARCEDVIATQLTPLQRRIFHLKHLRQQPIRAIAHALGKSEDAVKANLYRMRRAISAGTPGLEGILRG